VAIAAAAFVALARFGMGVMPVIGLAAGAGLVAGLLGA
jgi:hypothetical protein